LETLHAAITWFNNSGWKMEECVNKSGDDSKMVVDASRHSQDQGASDSEMEALTLCCYLLSVCHSMHLNSNTTIT
jgi:hypothetical protein